MTVINFFRENVEGVGVSCSSNMPQTCNVAEYNPGFLIFHLWVAGITGMHLSPSYSMLGLNPELPEC